MASGVRGRPGPRRLPKSHFLAMSRRGKSLRYDQFEFSDSTPEDDVIRAVPIDVAAAQPLAEIVVCVLRHDPDIVKRVHRVRSCPSTAATVDDGDFTRAVSAVRVGNCSGRGRVQSPGARRALLAFLKRVCGAETPCGEAVLARDRYAAFVAGRMS